MSIITILVILFAVLNTAFLVWTVYVLRGFSRFKLNDQTYMFEPQEHLQKGHRRRRTRKIKPSVD
jgi:hypothetical protein